MSTMGIPDTHKFEHADQILNSTAVRITFQSWQDIIVPPVSSNHDGDIFRDPNLLARILNYYNLVHPNEQRSKDVEITQMRLYLSPPQTETPDVFIMNPAMAYVLYRQSSTVIHYFGLLTI